METLSELETWLEEQCYSFQELSIGRHHAPEGIVIEEADGAFRWCYSERGHKSVYAAFDSEKELVAYALDKLKEDRWLQAHIIGFTLDEEKIKELGALLERKNIPYERNDIPNYRQGQRAYRIFVFGRDCRKTEHLKKKYLTW